MANEDEGANREHAGRRALQVGKKRTGEGTARYIMIDCIVREHILEVLKRKFMEKSGGGGNKKTENEHARVEIFRSSFPRIKLRTTWGGGRGGGGGGGGGQNQVVPLYLVTDREARGRGLPEKKRFRVTCKR